METNRIRVMKGKYKGQEANVLINNYDDEVLATDLDGFSYGRIPKEDVRFLTPVKFEGKFIAIGDTVTDNDCNSGVVEDCLFWNGGDCIVIKDEDGSRWIRKSYYLISHETGLEETKEMTVKEISEKLGYEVKIVK